MLTELYVIATGPTPPSVAGAQSASREAPLGIYRLQPSFTSRATFKKSAASHNAVALSHDHVFAAQSHKSVVHVYSRDTSALEAIVPFAEVVRAIAICNHENGGGYLVVGTESGRLIVWETISGRQITPPLSHIQAITCLAVNHLSTHLVSGSTDSTINVYSLPDLLAFPSNQDSSFTDDDTGQSPLRQIRHHRGAVTDLCLSSGSPDCAFCISISADLTVLISSLDSGQLLQQIVLPASPRCIALDPADRGVYVGLESGGIQMIDFFRKSGSRPNARTKPDISHPVLDSSQQASSQLAPGDLLWSSPTPEASPVSSVALSYDSSQLLSGHDSGALHLWDCARGQLLRKLTTFPAPITCLLSMQPQGFINPPSTRRTLKVHTVTKPRITIDNDSGIPPSHILNIQLLDPLSYPDLDNSDPCAEEWSQLLTTPGLPRSLMDRSVQELDAWIANGGKPPSQSLEAEDRLRRENQELKRTLGRIMAVQDRSWEVMMRWEREREAARGAGGDTAVGDLMEVDGGSMEQMGLLPGGAGQDAEVVDAGSRSKESQSLDPPERMTRSDGSSQPARSAISTGGMSAVQRRKMLQEADRI